MHRLHTLRHTPVRTHAPSAVVPLKGEGLVAPGRVRPRAKPSAAPPRPLRCGLTMTARLGPAPPAPTACLGFSPTHQQPLSPQYVPPTTSNTHTHTHTHSLSLSLSLSLKHMERSLPWSLLSPSPPHCHTGLLCLQPLPITSTPFSCQLPLTPHPSFSLCLMHKYT